MPWKHCIRSLGHAVFHAVTSKIKSVESTARQAADVPEHDHVRESVVSTGTATVRTGMEGLYLATSRAVEPPRVNTTMRLAWTWEPHHNKKITT